MGKACWHHPNKASYPDWVILLPNFLFHQVCTVVQRMKANAQNIAAIRGLIDALEYEYLRKRRTLDEAERIGANDEKV